MSNPFASDEYGRSTGSPRNLPPDSSKHGTSQAPFVPEDPAKKNQMDRVVIGLLSVIAVFMVFGLLIVLIMNISPNAPIRLTPTPEAASSEEESESEGVRVREAGEPQILGD
ncbi:hypothetical protein [Rubinisphaera margarita]|uniref:hypothetical protein n=1 Tax=Rubinisphaera margarita TaxID=2909586 RepID=UPI001EE855A1|nr:hypothetical protein [Rubinisphaera margarita]MCG6155264.1 hypothetical protein [Rubinisphaera margarita]